MIKLKFPFSRSKTPDAKKQSDTAEQFAIPSDSTLRKNRLKNKKTISIGVIVIAVIIAGGWFVLDRMGKIGNGQKVYAEAAGHKVYKSEIDDLIGKNKGISEHQAAQVLADKYLTEALAKERGITVTDNDLTAQFGKDVLKQKTTNKYLYQSNLNQEYFIKLVANNNGVYKGKYLVANFSRHIQVYPTLPEDKMQDPLLGNADAVAKDKQYAQDFITNLYNQITSGKITFDQAIQIEHNDPRVGLKAYPSLTHSGSFDTSYTPLGVLNAPSIREKINSIKAGETTKPFAVSVSVSLKNPNKTADSYFLVIHMDQTSGSYTGMDFSQYLDQAKKRLNYQVNV